MPEQVAARATSLVDSGLFDERFYTLLRGRSFSDSQEAAEDFVRWGMTRKLSPNPFLAFTSMPKQVRRAWVGGRVRVVLAFLMSDEGRSRPYGPLFDPSVYERPETTSGHDPLAEFLRTSTGETLMPVPATRRGPAPTRAAAESALLEAARGFTSFPPGPDDARFERAAASVSELAQVDWRAAADALARRVDGRTSVVIPTYSDCAMTIRAAGSVLDRADWLDVEVIVVDNGSPPHLALTMRAEFLGDDRVHYLRLPVNTNFAGGCNVGFAASTGDIVVFLNNDTEVRRGWLAPLRKALEDPAVAGAQPLLLYEDDSIQAAGTVFLRRDLLPAHLLVGHPKEDALGVAGRTFSAITGAAMALRAEDVVALRGFDMGYVNGFEDVDLCLRALRLRPGGFRVVPESVVTHYESRTPGRYDRVVENRKLFTTRWGSDYPSLDAGVYEELGFRLSRVDHDGQPVPAAVPRVHDRIRNDATHLRWSLKLPSTPGHWGDDWGDTHFADALARGLRHLGQNVVTCRYGTQETQTSRWDDVSLVIRGKYPIEPSPGKLNVLWVISHPDRVELPELEQFDLVFAASQPWSTAMTERSGRPVIPLLQATETAPLPSGCPVVERSREALFVGKMDEDRDRRLVLQAVEAGIPLAVHGPGWQGLPSEVWRSGYVPNDQLPDLYRKHAVVLADHWPDMARHGFVANRVFDALAAGAMVISDDVLGIEDVLGSRGSVCRTPGEISDSFARLSAARPEVGQRAARRFADTHSFLARASTLVAAVCHALSER
ncbi:MAG: glycosyltransferase [Nocardioides sp.]